MKLCWLDIRTANGTRVPIVEEAAHQRVDAIVADQIEHLSSLPPTVKKVFIPSQRALPEDLSSVDVVIVDTDKYGTTASLQAQFPGVEFGRFVEITDAATLDDACQAAREESYSVLQFRDPTKIPLEIVLAAASGAEGSIITVAADVEEAGIIFGVLEHGSGVMMAPEKVGDATDLMAVAQSAPADLDLVELVVTSVAHVGMGERACVDTCTYFNKDEGILVGSFSKGMVLCVSETHPLAYMPTRPFRVNAGAIMSYTVAPEGRTQYLSELRAGSKMLAVDIKGKTREVTVGRVKIESRPLLSVSAVSDNGTEVNLILQDDWHVRVLGPGGVVLNSTELKPGDKMLGYLPVQDRHVGYPINEFCREQ